MTSALTVPVLLAVIGCDAISISPSCPERLAVGESGPVAANEINPGAIPTYLWQVFPPDKGRFTSPTQPATDFEALEEGEVVIRLTASDGLYQMIASCTTRIEGHIDNSNENANQNDNDNDNANDNVNGNENDNANDNGADNSNDNSGGGGGRR